VTGKYPFGLDGPFEGLSLQESGGKPEFVYVPNPKQRFAHNCCADEILYGGAVYGGKSWFLLLHNAAHCMQYGKNARTILFRRSFDELQGSLIDEHRALFERQEVGTYSASAFNFNWNNGAVTRFRHLQDEGALKKHQSVQYTLIGFDEATHFTFDEYIYLFQRLRSPKDAKIHCQILLATNPRGPGHKWVKDRFIDGREPLRLYADYMPPYTFGRYRFPGKEYVRVFVPARAEDNEVGMKNDPAYLGRLKLSLPEDMFKAYVQGNWDTFEGMAFSDWNPSVHVVKAFTVPKHWKVIRSLDWGYMTPFSVGWLAQDPDTKAVYRIDEWYGARTGTQGGVSGLQLAVEEVRTHIVSREKGNVEGGFYPQPWYGVADPSIWTRTTEALSVGDRLNQNGLLFKAGNRDRIMGKQVFHSALRINPGTGKPGFLVFDNCKSFLKTFPNLTLESKGGEDVNTADEDHVYDECRYGLVELTQAPATREAQAGRGYAAVRYRTPVAL
jgi:hypothetical protein